MTYSMKITVSRSDVEGVDLTIDMPEVGRDKIAAENPALASVFDALDFQLIPFTQGQEQPK